MDLDNPSYFSVPEERQFGVVQRRSKMGNTESVSSGASECSLSRQLTSPRNNRNNQVRNFLRSVSTNSAESNQELLIMGEPRLSDIAPDLAFKHPSRSNSLKKHQDSTYHPLPTSEEAADELSSDEVFIAEESARYYNLSAMKRSPRRHSIGTFMSRERTCSVASSSKSFKEDFPQALMHANPELDGAGAIIDDHSLRHMSYPRKRCTKCTKGSVSRQANMDDILIVSLKSSDAANLWVEYFSNYFQQISKQSNRKSFKIQYLSAEEIIECKGKEKDLSDKTSGVKLQLVVVCPNLLEFITAHPEESQILGKIILADRTLALLLGVNDNDLTEFHKKAFPTYFQWQRQCVGQDQDENFTKEFLGQAMAILSKIWKQQSSVIAQEKSCFSVTPKKIRQGQNGVFILLTHPLQKEDIIKISIEKNGDIVEIKSVKRRNPYIVKIQVPENLTQVTAIVNVLVEKNGSIIGSRPIKCESKLRELEQILRSSNDPVEFMCQTLGFTPADRDHLDNWLVHSFQRNLPPQFNLLANHATPFAAAVQVHKHSHEEFPTLLHFAAKFGLTKLAVTLLDCPGADVAYEIRNIYDMTPLEIAEANSHSELASMLGGYMNMNEVTSMYTKLKVLTSSPEVDEDGYLTPNNIPNPYTLCPAPRPVLPLTEPSTVITTPTSDCSTPAGYMSMDNHHTKATVTPSNPYDCPKEFWLKDDLESVKSSKPDVNEPSKLTKQQKEQEAILEDKVQKELVEIINDFKNNVHSIAQVEKLVEEWKNRNDVQKSFKEKQEQLLEMRLRYEKIQHEIKASTKKSSTPLDRIKKLFSSSRHKHEKQDISCTQEIQNLLSPTNGVSTNPAQRPISSLSTSSSGSSGRMSTISGCSLGDRDSGTHSDNEERKLMFGSTHNDEDFRNEMNKAIMELNYTPVPAPKPVKMESFNLRFETIEEKPSPRPENLPLNTEYYIRFPPSGLPVTGLTEHRITTTPNNEYMNIAAGSLSDCPDYMNFPSLR